MLSHGRGIIHIFVTLLVHDKKENFLYKVSKIIIYCQVTYELVSNFEIVTFCKFILVYLFVCNAAILAFHTVKGKHIFDNW